MRSQAPTRTSPTSASAAPTAPGEPALDRAAWTVEALRSVWRHQQSRVSDRIAVIERALAALAEDRLEDDLRAQAERAAHMLAGSIGMFGFLAASDAARELEVELAQPTPDRAPALAALAARLRSGVQEPVVLRSDTAAARRARRALR